MLQVSLSFPPLPLSGTSCNVQYRCPSAVRHVTYNIDVQYIDVQYSGSPAQRETWSKSMRRRVLQNSYFSLTYY
jgi:hypothetical protein